MLLEVCCPVFFRRELRKKGKSKVPLKSRDWVMTKKQRLRDRGR